MSLISRVEISNYLTEGLETNHYANWNPMLTGITLRMDCQSALINITNGGGKTSMAELLLLVLSRDKTLLQRVREKSAPKGRGYTHARIEFREVDKTSFREPSLLEIDTENLPGQTRVIGLALTNDVADAPLFYSYSGTLEDSPCYTLANGVLNNVPDDQFAKRTRALPGCQWNSFRNAGEWQAHVGDAISMDVVRRNTIYQTKGSDDKNASFFSFKPRAGDSYDAAFFRNVIASDLLSNLLNSFADDEEVSIEDTLHSSLSQIVTSERTVASKQAHLESREAAIQVDLKPVVTAGSEAGITHAAMQDALIEVRKDVTLLHHFGSQDSTHPIPGLPRPVHSLKRSEEQDARIRQAIKGMVIHREDGILVMDKTLAELATVEVRVINQAVERRHIPNASLNSQVIDFACDFGISSSGKAGGGHYRKGYTLQAVRALLPLLGGTSGATLTGLDEVFQIAFETAQAQLDTNPAAMQVYALQTTLDENELTLVELNEGILSLESDIEGLDSQIKGRADNEAAWGDFQKICPHLPVEHQKQPKQAKSWLSEQVDGVQAQLGELNLKKGALSAQWDRYLAAMDEAGLAGIEGVRTEYAELKSEETRVNQQRSTAERKVYESQKARSDYEAAVTRALLHEKECQNKVNQFGELKTAYAVFTSYFGEVDPRDVEHPSITYKAAAKKSAEAAKALENASEEFQELVRLKSSAVRFAELFGPEIDALHYDPTSEHRIRTQEANLAQQSMQPLEPLITALEAFRVKYPNQPPADWIVATNQRRNALEQESRSTQLALESTQNEIAALDGLSVVDDAAFSKAWAVLGEGPQRLYALLQSLEGTTERRIGALSALTGLLSAPVFETEAQLAQAAALLEAHDIGIPLLLKQPLLQAIGARGDVSGDLQVMGFFAGRLSRQAKVLLDPAFAKQQRAKWVNRIQELEQRLNEIEQALTLVHFHSPEYVMAMRAAEAVKSGAESKFAEFEAEWKLADEALKVLAPRIKPDALASLAAQRDYLLKGGEPRKDVLQTECGVLRQLAEKAAQELVIADRRASPESSNAYSGAIKFVNEGGEAGYLAQAEQLEEATGVLDAVKWSLATYESEHLALVAKFENAHALAVAFQEKNGHDRVEDLRLVVEFVDQKDDLAFMQGYKAAHDAAVHRQKSFTAYLSSVNFERADAYYSNLDKSQADLATASAEKRALLAQKQARVKTLDEQSRRIQGAEMPNWVKLRKAIHDLAYELGKQAAATKAAYSEFGKAKEDLYPVEAHPLYDSLHHVVLALRNDKLEPTVALVSQIGEVQSEVELINPQSSLETFNSKRKAHTEALQGFESKKQLFCENASSAASSGKGAFNPLELDVIGRSTPEQIKDLIALFERLNASLEKDREDAQKAIHAAELANEEAVNNLSKLIQIAQNNLDAMDAVMKRYPKGCFKIKVQLAGADLVRDILIDLTDGLKLMTAGTGNTTRTLRRSDEGRIKEYLRETLVEKIFLDPKVNFVHTGIRPNETAVTDKLSTGQKVALEFMWIVRQAEYEIERGIRTLSSKQAARKRQDTNRVIFVDGIFSTLSDRRIISEAFNGLGNLGGNFQIIGFLHSPTWTNDSSVFPVYHVGKKLTNNSGDSLVQFSEDGRKPGTLGFFTAITRTHGQAA